MRRATAAVLLSVFGVAVVVVAAALVGRFVLHGGVDERSLAWSVSAEAGTDSTFTECRRKRDAQQWSCVVSDGSGGAGYRVIVRRGSSCWDARLTSGQTADVPREAEGCVHLWQWSLLGLLLE